MTMSNRYSNDSRQRGGQRPQRMMASDVPRPKTKEEAEALCDLCSSHIAEIDASLSSKTVDQFPSRESFESWQRGASIAREKWQQKYAEVRHQVEVLLTRESLVEDLERQVRELRSQGASREARTLLERTKAKATTRRANLFLERCLVYAVLTGDAPEAQREQLKKDLETRIPAERYQKWLARAREVVWTRRGPIGRFDFPGRKKGATDAQVSEK